MYINEAAKLTGTTKKAIEYYCRPYAEFRIITIAEITFSVFMVTGRLISGVHWFTDIVGGELLSAGLFKLYKAAVMLALKEK